MAELDALREGVAALLDASGARREAGIVRGGSLSLVGAPQRWTVGSREVAASSVELALDADAFAALRAEPAGHARVRDALADAMAGSSTMLAELFVVLRLPSVEASWGAVYRTAPTRGPEPPAEPAAVQGAAAELLRAEKQGGAAEVLERARLSVADVPSSGPIPLRRWVVLLRPADHAESARQHEAIRRAVEAAATRAAEVVAGVEIAVA